MPAAAAAFAAAATTCNLFGNNIINDRDLSSLVGSQIPEA